MVGSTRTGQVLEAMILPSLVLGGYEYTEQVIIGQRPNGGQHKVDVIARKDNRSVLISLKWQQVSGTAEQKVPYEVICLMAAVAQSSGNFDQAYIVLGGPGWSLRDYYISGGLNEYLSHFEYVSIVTLEDFIARANRGNL